ncbi:MAG: GspE/PulE family protein [bacterium]|nr:GspE/PulE family protein [bacterium]
MVHIPSQKLKEQLLKDKLITSEAFDAIDKEASRMGQDLSDLLISRNIMRRGYYYNILSAFFGTEMASLTNKVINQEVLKLVPEDIARARRVITFEQNGNIVSVAMEDPTDINTLEFLKKRLKKDIKPFLALPEDIDKGFVLYGAESSKDFRKLIEENISASLRSRARGDEEKAAEIPIVSIADNIVAYAYALRASDVHLEMLETEVLLRYRIDGVLREITRMPKLISSALVARFKLLAGLKLDEHFTPQDGRFRQKSGPETVDLRVSIVPTSNGEKVVMRLLAATQRPLSLEDLGMTTKMIQIVKKNIEKSYGMFLVTGPTGSGKTTTLYSVLNMLNHPEVNIVTIEDPIEYNIKYVNQTQINTQAGINFASGLRAFLRQDPDIILVGEIRDEETADISVNAALTGHLVLSTLHTNDAPTAIPRLFDLKVAPFLCTAVLNAIMAQRLVRQICTECIYSYTPEASLEGTIKMQTKILGLKEEFKMPKRLYRGKGCSVCGDSGYRGRLGIYEILDVTEEVRKVIVDDDFNLDKLRIAARNSGMITMFEDGLNKVERGVTTIEEVLRVIRE